MSAISPSRAAAGCVILPRFLGVCIGLSTQNPLSIPLQIVPGILVVMPCRVSVINDDDDDDEEEEEEEERKAHLITLDEAMFELFVCSASAEPQQLVQLLSRALAN
jgi:hypothetical protein